MARWFSTDPQFTQIGVNDNALRNKIMEILSRHQTEMEGYSYFGSNPGIPVDDFEDVADDIMNELNLNTNS